MTGVVDITFHFRSVQLGLGNHQTSVFIAVLEGFAAVAPTCRADGRGVAWRGVPVTFSVGDVGHAGRDDFTLATTQKKQKQKSPLPPTRVHSFL